MPESDPVPPGLELRIGILHTVRRRLLSLILLVVPRRASPDLLQVDVFAVQSDFVQDALILIIIAPFAYTGEQHIVVLVDPVTAEQISKLAFLQPPRMAVPSLPGTVNG